LKISNREKKLISVTLAVIISLSYYNFFYKDLYRQINLIKDEIHVNKLNLEDSSYTEIQIQDMQVNLSQLEVDSQGISSIYDSKKINPQIIIFIEESIEGLGISTKLKFEDALEYDDYHTATVSLNLETNYTNLKKIIANIEEIPWPVAINHIKIDKKQSNTVNRDYNCDVELILSFLVFKAEENY